jgi:hypothetical protein
MLRSLEYLHLSQYRRMADREGLNSRCETNPRRQLRRVGV